MCNCDAIFHTGHVVWWRKSASLSLPQYYHGKMEMDKEYWGHVDRSKCPDGKAAVERLVELLIESTKPKDLVFDKACFLVE